jgi:hypothetical protein
MQPGQACFGKEAASSARGFQLPAREGVYVPLCRVSTNGNPPPPVEGRGGSGVVLGVI